tara:strand:+ start:2454 stop:2612 length:159 start_codon:yes stop_codon:yes gene_type:complete
MARMTIKDNKKKRKNKIASKPPHAAPSGTRWVKGKDGWMLHEKTDPNTRYRA